MSDYLIHRSEHIVRDSSVTVLNGSAALNVLDRTVSTKLCEMGNLDTKKTLFCDSNGRIEDMATVFMVDQQILLITSAEHGEATRKKLVDGIGWDEECILLNGDDAISHISVICRDPTELLSLFGPGNVQLSKGKSLEFVDILIHKTEFDSCDKVDILVPKAKFSSVMGKLKEFDSKVASEERWDFIRISLGVPNIEDAQGNLPNEVGMDSLVNLDKGCYPGQEIHARIDSRGRTVKNLIRIKANTPIEIGIQKVEGIGKIRVTSTRIFSGVSLSLGICPIIDESVGEILLEDGSSAIVEPLIFP